MIKKNKKNIVLMIIVNLLILLSDWNFLILNINFSVSDLLMATTFVVLLIYLMFHQEIYLNLKNKYLKVIKLILATLLIHLVIQLIFNLQFDFFNAFFTIIKFIIYFSFIIFFKYSFSTKTNKLILSKSIEIFSILASIIGIYIMLLLYLNKYFSFNTVFYEFFWQFTRTDSNSYLLFGGTVIRLRSLFSEPAHIGIYLNFVLYIFYFNDFGIKFNYKYSRILFIITIMLSFSLAAIIIYFVIEFFNIYRNKTFSINKNITWVILILIFLSIFRKQINESLFLRIKMIINGEDNSALIRLFDSWIFVYKPIIGNGIGNTPIIVNSIAYLISDFGFPFAILIFYKIIKIFDKRWYLLFPLFLINFAKGGYLSSYNYVMIALVLVYFRLDFQSKFFNGYRN